MQGMWPVADKGAKLRISITGQDVLSGRTSSVVATGSEAVHASGDAETVTRTVTVAVTVPGSGGRGGVQLHETPQDFSRGDLRGGRDLNRTWAKNETRVGTRTWLLSHRNDSVFLFPSRASHCPAFPSFAPQLRQPDGNGKRS